MARLHARESQVAHMPAQPLAGLPHGCAWNGCPACFAGQIPDGWRWLLVHGGDPVPRFDDIPLSTIDQDTVLCPEHASMLNRLLKHVGNLVG